MNILGCEDQRGDVVEKYVLSLFCSKRFKSDEIRKLFSYEDKKHILKGHFGLYDRLLHDALPIPSKKTQKYLRVRCHALVPAPNIALLWVVV